MAQVAQIEEFVGHRSGTVTLESPIEDLKLTRMTQNTLKRAGCTTVGHILEVAFKRRFRRFGAGGREEVRLALQSNGIELPSEKADRAVALAEAERRLDHLQRQIEADVRRWQQQVEVLAEIIRELE